MALRIAELASANLPLADGLAAAAAESDSGRVRGALLHLAQQIRSGISLVDAVNSSGSQLTPYLAGFLQAAERTGNLGVVLTEWMENRWAARARWRSVSAALAYPLLTLGLALGVFVFLAWFVVPPFREMMTDFGLRLPQPTVVLFFLADVALPVVLLIGAVALIGLLLVRVGGGAAPFTRLLTAMPLVGKLWYWSGSAEGLRALGLLVENQVPLPEALELTGSGIADAYIGASCRRLAGSVSQGQTLWQALLQSRELPLSIVPLVRLGESTGTLGSCLRTSAEMLENRVQDRSLLILQVCPPLVLVLVNFMVGTVVVGLMLPLVGLIQGLS